MLANVFFFYNRIASVGFGPTIGYSHHDVEPGRWPQLRNCGRHRLYSVPRTPVAKVQICRAVQYLLMVAGKNVRRIRTSRADATHRTT